MEEEVIINWHAHAIFFKFMQTYFLTRIKRIINLTYFVSDSPMFLANLQSSLEAVLGQQQDCLAGGEGYDGELDSCLGVVGGDRIFSITLWQC